MTKKHFELTANALRNRAKAITLSSASNEEKNYALFELRNLMYYFNDFYRAENSRFDEIKFLETCKLEKYFQIIRKDIYLEKYIETIKK
tara:strand:+ start:75 stop:341 length:267 start_codon:yes stop_codon:yes gene_type:complete